MLIVNFQKSENNLSTKIRFTQLTWESLHCDASRRGWREREKERVVDGIGTVQGIKIAEMIK